LNVSGVVAALAAEARTLGPTVNSGEGCRALADGTLVTISGIGRAAAGRAARRLIEAGAMALVSWGMAGGLDPDLEAGVVCLPCEVIDADGTRYTTSRQWREALAASIAPHRVVAAGNLLTSLHPIDSVAAKGAAYLETGAGAVDMESSGVAQAAAAHGLPFVAVRVIVDTANDALPRAVTAASRSGQVRMAPLLLGLLRSPTDMGPILRLARRYRAAIRSLAAVAASAKLAPPAKATAPGLRQA
jgi:adenosylhomocysteine nucleosidase